MSRTSIAHARLWASSNSMYNEENIQNAENTTTTGSSSCPSASSPSLGPGHASVSVSGCLVSLFLSNSFGNPTDRPNQQSSQRAAEAAATGSLATPTASTASRSAATRPRPGSDECFLA
ncbi:hypothetical protein ON010_g13730 [Phytophthora cinnamomi]|nr:hypothetical protein ON010_g13730 [Phytophthora cinnamomi]